ncbi:NmrA/HSCARG family protein [Paraliomyxa miuraensis]|uniref:NmrA/HSCARG family protein n=1 Tax=Paraliomyxa miuraensis TaxID=376150 RepID=UPI00224F226B|nr:NmrA/HSCARG family protein [Paraliomyxa miuraensis]MCX4242672.1 NmrA/HSCARG family protein [Paraliomyxa miuraensis]
MSTNNEQIIAVIGATGRQGGGVVRALKAQGKFRVRALTRNPAEHEGLADEVVRADLSEPATLTEAFAGAHGAFVVTNFWEGGGGVDELAQCTAAVRAAKAAGVQHFVWSTLPNVEEISGGKFHVPHFTNKALADAVVSSAGFAFHTFVEAPFYFQNLTSVMSPQPQPDGSKAWVLPLDPSVRCIHMGDIDELGNVVAGAFANPERVGQGQVLSLCGSLVAFDDVVAAFRGRGWNVGFVQVPREVYAGFYPEAEEMAEMIGFFQAHTYMGPDAEQKIALANEVATHPPTDLRAWVESVTAVLDASVPGSEGS